MSRQNIFSVALLAAVTQFPAMATNELDPVVVTATRTAQTVNETLSAVTVITRSQIEQSSANSLPELISGSVGIDIKTSGGYGKSSSIFIRGTESKHVLLLVDGVRFHDAVQSNASANFQYLPLDIIERIEIVRGPKASLYGSDAIGGVIQVFTKPDHDTRYASIGFGSNNSQQLKAGISGSEDQLRYSLRASHFQTDGISTKDGNSEKDGYNNTSLSAQAEYELSHLTTVGFTTHRTEGETEYDYSDSATNYRTDFTQWAADGYLKQTINDNWRTEFHLGKSNHERLSKLDATGDYHAQTQTVSWLNEIKLSDPHTLIGGIDYVRDNASQSYTSSVDWSRESIALFGNLSAMLESGNQYSAGLRHEDNQQFGTHLTGDIAYEWLLSDDSTIRTSYGEAFKAPSLYNLYNQSGWNQNLNPEKSKTIEVSLTTGDITLSLFNTEITNLISYQNWTDGYENIGKAEIDGLELEMRANFSGWNLTPSLTLLNPMDRTNNKQLQSRAKQTLKIHGERKIKANKFSFDWITQSHRYSYGDVYTAGYGKLDLQLSRPLNKKITLNAKAGNILDQHYQLNNGYNTEGRNAFFSLNYRM